MAKRRSEGDGMKRKNGLIGIGSAVALAAMGVAHGESTLLSGFETPGAWNTQGGGWYCFTDKTNGGESVITTADSMSTWDTTSFAPGAAGTEGSLKVGFRFGTINPTCGEGCAYPPQIGFGTNMFGELDITGATAISFWAKADAPLEVTVGMGTTEVTDNGNFSILIPITSAWARYTIKLTDLAQPDWAAPVAFNPAHVLSIGIGVSKGDNASITSGAVYLDEVTLESWVPPIDPSAVSDRSSRAFGTGTWVVGDRFRVSLPAVLRGKPGRVSAYDARGAERGHARFSAGDRIVDLRLPGGADKGRMYLRFDAR